jgi:S1-C subfamily serine protease
MAADDAGPGRTRTGATDPIGIGGLYADDKRRGRAARRPKPEQPRDDRRWPARWLPRTALGIALVLFCMSVASAFTGAVLYAYYEYRLGKTEERVDEFEATFAQRMDRAVERIARERDDAVAQVRSQLDELERFSASGETLAGLLDTAQPSVWFVSTSDPNGSPSAGSAFVAFSDDTQSFLLTSHTTVRAATTDPGPEVIVRKGDDELRAELTAWDPANDLALLVVDRGELPALTWAPTEPPLRVGDRVFAVSGLGGSGGSVTQGFVAGVSAEGLQHDAPIGAAFQGGPLLNSQGEVVAVASRTYAPLNFETESVFFGVPVRNACAEVVRCPEDGQPG